MYVDKRIHRGLSIQSGKWVDADFAANYPPALKLMHVAEANGANGAREVDVDLRRRIPADPDARAHGCEQACPDDGRLFCEARPAAGEEHGKGERCFTQDDLL